MQHIQHSSRTAHLAVHVRMENKDGGKAGKRARQRENKDLQRIVQNGIETCLENSNSTHYSSGPSSATLQGKRARLANLTFPLHPPSFCPRRAGDRGLNFIQFISNRDSFIWLIRLHIWYVECLSAMAALVLRLLSWMWRRVASWIGRNLPTKLHVLSYCYGATTKQFWNKQW
jgi:hypothetical protein